VTVKEFRPHSQLAAFIDGYWEVSGDEVQTSIDGVLPDGCIDILINVGEDFHIESENMVLKAEKAYVGGAITHCIEAKTLPGMHMVGVRFKPGAFSHFYSFSSLHEITNLFVEVSAQLVPQRNLLSKDISLAFDSFFLTKLIQPKHSLLPVIETVKSHRGDILVSQLADRHFTTVRQLERHFQYYVGLSPKEFTNIIRYKFAQELIQSSHPKRTLGDIAFECGYYDQAHLSNEIKKYTGVAPTNL